MKFLFFAERWIFESASAAGQSAAVSTLNQSSYVENFEILANGDLRCAKALRQIHYQNSAVAQHHFQDGATPFLVEQAVSLNSAHVFSVSHWSTSFIPYASICPRTIRSE